MDLRQKSRIMLNNKEVYTLGFAVHEVPTYIKMVVRRAKKGQSFISAIALLLSLLLKEK